jgi:hypothetical protein
MYSDPDKKVRYVFFILYVPLFCTIIIQHTCFYQYNYNFLIFIYKFILSSTLILEVTSSDPLLQEGEQILPRPLLSYYHPLQVQKRNLSKPNLTKPNQHKNL